MAIEDPPACTLADMQTLLDRAAAYVAAGRIVAASEVRARLRLAITVTDLSRSEADSPS